MNKFLLIIYSWNSFKFFEYIFEFELDQVYCYHDSRDIVSYKNVFLKRIEEVIVHDSYFYFIDSLRMVVNHELLSPVKNWFYGNLLELPWEGKW